MPQDNTDILGSLQEASEEAGKLNVQLVRDVKVRAINRPAWAEKLTKQQRLDQHRAFITNPVALEEEYDAAVARFSVPDGHVPRRWLEYGVLAKRELEQEQT